ncbi:MAG TPA: SRPBCC family protein [Polyangiaceae bacterium]
MRNPLRASSYALGAALGGAGAMYFFDPAEGARRRSYLGHRMVHIGHTATDFSAKARRDFAYRARGMGSRIGRIFESDDVPDTVVIERVRAELGRSTSHPHAITVRAEDGNITLSGPILAQEAKSLLSCVRRVRGVRGISNALDVHETSEEVPSLQGGQQRLRRPEIAQDNWTPSLRVLVGLTGAALGVVGRGRKGALGALVVACGAGLFVRAATNLPARRLIGIGAGPRAIDLHKTIVVAAPIDEVFAVFANFEQFPRFMEHVREITITGEGRSRWTVAGPAGAPIAFDVEINQLSPSRVLSWRTMPESVIEHTGTVQFEEQPDGATRLDVRMSYNPMAGAMGHAVAKLFRVDPKHALDADLVRFKSLLEEGKTRAHHQPVTREDILDRSRDIG